MAIAKYILKSEEDLTALIARLKKHWKRVIKACNPEFYPCTATVEYKRNTATLIAFTDYQYVRDML